MNPDTIIGYIKELGATMCQFVTTRDLIPEERIREYCYENKCGSYNKHLTCPPRTGTIAEIKEKLQTYNLGILIQYGEQIDVKNDAEGRRRTKLRLHRLVLETEKYLRENLDFKNIWGLIGGNCGLCDECAGFRSEPCTYPDQARASMEAVALDVMSLLGKLDLDNKFYDDKITWTGIVLMERKS